MEVWKRCRTHNSVFFTRKATLAEGLAALKSGALAVLKKPDPIRAEVIGSPLAEAYDSAFRNKSRVIASELSNEIRKASWWWKHREAVYTAIIALFIGYLASILANLTPVLLRGCQGR